MSKGFVKLTVAAVVPKFQAAVAALPGKADAAGAEAMAVALLDDADKARASDIHLDTHEDQVRLRFRIDGAIVNVAHLEAWCGRSLIGYLKTNAGMEPAPALEPIDSHLRLTIGGKALDVRLACAPCAAGEKLTLRLLGSKNLRFTLRDLGLADDDIGRIADWIDDISGILVIAGPTGSGKTTTLYSLLDELDLAEKSVITIEDPVEYQLENINQIQVNEKRGVTFSSGLRAILRHDPDYILLGEIRDRASAETALEAANVGHVILSTLHSRDAAGVVTTLRSFGLEDHEIAGTVAFVVAQRLVRRLCRECRETAAPLERDARWLDSLGIAVPASVGHRRGCSKCNDRGYRGQIGVFELWPIDREGYAKILDHADEYAIRRSLRERGLHSLLEDGVAKAAEGIIDLGQLRQMGARTYLDRGAD